MPTGDIWISGHYLMPDDAHVRNEIGFFETEMPSYTNWIDFWVAPKAGGGTTLTLGLEFLGAKEVWTGDFAKGKWHQIAIHVLQSKTATGGSVDFWLDGQQVVTAYKHQTKPNDQNFFFQAGLHRKDTSNDTDVIFMDDFIQGTTQADLQLAAPGQPSDGGATPDGAGAAGTPAARRAAAARRARAAAPRAARARPGPPAPRAPRGRPAHPAAPARPAARARRAVARPERPRPGRPERPGEGARPTAAGARARSRATPAPRTPWSGDWARSSRSRGLRRRRRRGTT